MKTLGKRELTERIDEILRLVKERGETFEVMEQGEVVAHIGPGPAREAQPSDKPSLTPFWEKMERLAAKIDAFVPDKVDAVEIVREGRREF